jgi:hypothetical protein
MKKMKCKIYKHVQSFKESFLDKHAGKFLYDIS